MCTIGVQDVQGDPLAFFRRVEAGEPFLVVKDGQRLAEVRPVATPAARPRPFGRCADRFAVSPDFARPQPDDLLPGFEGA